MIEYVYNDSDNGRISEQRYVDFVQLYYGHRKEQKLKRIRWYQSRGKDNYKLLLAIKDGKLVGQTCAYRVKAEVAGVIKNLWWGVDCFVLDGERGQGIGKGLQKKLHDDLENFSSVQYSRPNGFIKRQCGSTELIRIPFNYIPVSTYCSLLFRIALKRLTHKEVSFPRMFKNKYLYINRLFKHTPRNLYYIKEICINELESLTPFINTSLKEYDFYIRRDREYLKWKYVDNPSVGKIHILGFYSLTADEPMGCIICSEPLERSVFTVQATVFTVLDCFVFDNRISKKEILLDAIDWYNDRYIIDGVMYIGNIDYFPLFRHPFSGRAFLSTMTPDTTIQHAYVGYSDQDMEQIF